MHQARHPLFFIVARRKAIELPVVGIPRYVPSMGRKAILRHLARRSKPHATSLNVFRGRMERRLPQYNNKLRGTWRKRECLRM
jgi:hypothetical protein